MKPDDDGLGFLALPIPEGPSLAAAFWGPGVEDVEDSGFGSSYHSVLMLCPRRFFFQNVERLRPSSFGEVGVTPRTYSLLRGWLMHACCQVFYGGGMSDTAKAETYERLNAAGQVPAYVDLVTEVEWLWTGYLDRYMTEDRHYLEVIAVEQPLHVADRRDDDEFLYTIRADLIVRNKTTGLVYIYEHKNLSTFGDSERTGYLLDLQVQGEAYTFVKNHPGTPFGGVILNVTVCTKTPSFYRVPITFSERQLQTFGRSMRIWHALKAFHREWDWPQNWASCKTRYPGARGGNCDFLQLCLTGYQPRDIRDKPPPAGFVRKDRLVRKEHLK